MIIWLASFPRSGNNFFRVVSRDFFGREIFSIYEEKRAYIDQSEFKRMSKDSDVFLVKTHEMPPDDKKAVYLVRDGRDSLVSLAWYNLNQRGIKQEDVSSDRYQEALRGEILSSAHGGWSRNVLAWIRRPDQTVIVRFEELIIHPVEVMREAFETLGLLQDRKQNGKLLTFEELHTRNPNLYRSGKVGGWKDAMTEELHDLFWKVHGQGMDALGYQR